MRFSFKYNGVRYGSDTLSKRTVDGKDEYLLDTLVIRRESVRYGNAEYSLLHFKNDGEKNSGTLSDIYDIDDTVYAPGVTSNDFPRHIGYYEKQVRVIPTIGCNGQLDEFLPVNNAPLGMHASGEVYRNLAGRSSHGYMPFFEVTDNDEREGFLLAIGWTGGWVAGFTPEGDKVRVTAGVDGVETYLLPGESIRTASVLLLPYFDGTVNAHNEFRKIISDNFTPKGLESGYGPLATSNWGGARSSVLKSAIKKQADESLGFEYFWIDAGWYGDNPDECPDEFTGDWYGYTGDWFVNKNIHPEEMRDVFALAARNGMKGILWFEPERCCKSTKAYKAHPEWYIDIGDRNNSMLNLALDEPRKFALETVSDFIEKLSLSCYRQDCNFNMYDYWYSVDGEGRRGITHLKYIEGLYWFWDSLLQRFPDLIIDNCASGGRRLDIETARRSLPLWRSDINCAFDFEPMAAQNQTVGLSRWLPYHGGGAGQNLDDTYRFRSAHAPALVSNFLGYEAFACEKYDFALIKGLIEEYKQVRELYSKSYYPVFGTPHDEYSWSGWQFYDGERGVGTLSAFRRSRCNSSSVTVYLGEVDESRSYEFTFLPDPKTDETARTVTVSGSELIRNGFTFTAEKPSSAILVVYKRI